MRKEDMEFDWDSGNSPKILERFSIDEVEHFFTQVVIEIPDVHHSQNEERIIAIGNGPGGKLMYVCFTIRANRVRVISARFMRMKEAQKYENFKKD